MELSEYLKYRLAYLTLRLALDRKLSRVDAGAYPGLLAFLDALAGTQLAAEAGGRRYASQRDAEFGEDVLQLVQRAVAEIV
jgi:hypothetical protein